MHVASSGLGNPLLSSVLSSFAMGAAPSVVDKLTPKPKQLDGLGFGFAEIASVVGSVASAKNGGGDGGGGGMPPGGDTNINPAFQQSFTPQFSPTMQQVQDSPGSTQSAAPTQIATGGQTASTAGGGPSPYGALPSANRSPFPSSFLPTRPVVQSDQYGQYIKWGVIAALGLGALYLGNNALEKPLTSARIKSAVKRSVKRPAKRTNNRTVK